MKKKILLTAIGVVLTALLGFAGLALSSLHYDKSNPRNRPNSYLIEVSVKVNKPIHYVYHFVKFKKADIYTKLTNMHNQFKIVNAKGLIEGAKIVCIEADDDDVVHHNYVVTKNIENELIQYESTPTIILDKETNQKIGECNTYVYYDFEKIDKNNTIIRQTIVIDMLNPVYKAIGDIIGIITDSREVWNNQFTEELNTLKAYIEE